MADATQAAQWWDLLGKFREASANVDAVLARLRSQEDAARRNAILSREFDAMMSRAATMRAGIASTLQTIEGAIASLRGLVDWIPGLGTLGNPLLPVLGVAAVAASLASITKFLVDAWALSKRIDEQMRLEAAGLTPQEAAGVVARVTQEGAGQSLAMSIVKPLAIGGALYLVLRFVLSARRGA